MTRYAPLRFALPLVLAASLAACGGGPDVSDTVADEGVSSSTQAPDDQDTDEDTDEDTDQDGDDGNPGGPGDDGGDGGDGGGDEGGGNPGGPGDLLVFEESNVEYGDFRDNGSGRVCEVEGRCTLQTNIIKGEEDPDTGVDFCLISTFDYSSGTRPKAGEPRDVFTEGATVTANLKCAEPVDPETSEAEESEAEESEAEESESEESQESQESETEETPADESPADSGDGSEG